MRNQKRSVLRCGRRFGKSTLLETSAGNWSAGRPGEDNGQLIGWFCPDYKRLLPSYQRILRLLTPIVTRKSRIDGIIETATGGAVEFWTLNDQNAGRSRFYDWAIIDEAGLVEKGLRDIWEQSIAPTLLDRNGSAIMAGTPKGIDPENFLYTACTDKTLGWIEHHAPTASNPKLDANSVARLIHEYPPLVYQQEYLAEFVDWSGEAFFALSSFMDENGQPFDTPNRVDSVFAIVDTAAKTGKENDGTGVTFFADRQWSKELWVLDWELRQIEGAMLSVWLPSVFERLEELAAECGAIYGSTGAYIEDKSSGIILLQQARDAGWPVEAIDNKLTSLGKVERAINASGHVYQKRVKLTRRAHERVSNYRGVTRNHWVSQVTGFRVSQKDAEDDLLDTMTYGVDISLGNASAYT